MNRPDSPKQLLIGLDAMDWYLVRRWVAENKMPTFRRLMEEGTQAELSTISDRQPDTSWNCICSGLNPAHLARYFYVQHDPETAGLRYMPDASSGVNYFWDHLSAAGRRVEVVDVPHVDTAPRFGTIELRNQDARTGSHAPRMFLLASGQGIPKGATISGASIFDFVPTILYAAGMRTPTICEGRPPVPRIVCACMIGSRPA